MVNSLLFSCVLLIGVSNPFTVEAAQFAVDRYANDGSHNLKCYVPGQCQEFSVDFEGSQGPDECGQFCNDHNKKLQDDDVHRCNWWSWIPGQDLCMMFHNCTENGDRPDGTRCPNCLTGEDSCQQRQCVMGVKCKGHLTEGSLKQFTAGSLRECISSCAYHPDCKFYTFQNNSNFCILYEDCDKDPQTNEYMPCDGCQTGELSCTLGHLPAPIITEANGFLTNNTHRHALNVEFNEEMRTHCDQELGIGRYLIEDDNSQCKHFYDCTKEVVWECDVDYAFNPATEQCYNRHKNYKKDGEKFLCKGELLKSEIYHHTHGGPTYPPSNN